MHLYMPCSQKRTSLNWTTLLFRLLDPHQTRSIGVEQQAGRTRLGQARLGRVGGAALDIYTWPWKRGEAPQVSDESVQLSSRHTCRIILENRDGGDALESEGGKVQANLRLWRKKRRGSTSVPAVSSGQAREERNGAERSYLAVPSLAGRPCSRREPD